MDDGSRGEEIEVEITLTKSETGTRMILVQCTFADIATRDDHYAGWSSSFNDLDKVFG